MGGKSSSRQSPPSTQTVTQRAEIPAFLRPFVERQAEIGTGALESLEGQLGGAGAGQLVTPFDPLQEEAFSLAEARARGAGGFIPAAQEQFLRAAQGGFALGGPGIEQLTRTAQGDFLSSPQFQSSFEAALRRAQPQISSTFGLAGRTGSGLAQVAQTQASADAFANLFNQERQRQLQAGGVLSGLRDADRQFQLAAAGQLPEFAGLDVDILQQIGAARQGQAQRELLAPLTAQESLLAAAGGGIPLQSLLGSTQSGTATQPIFRNRGAGALGGALSGASIGSSFGPIGAGIGGVGGLLLGGLLS